MLINIVMVTAILSTMLAATFGLGRMIRSLAAEGHAPSWLKEKTDVPYRGILFSGLAMLGGLGLGFLLPITSGERRLPVLRKLRVSFLVFR
ncbi:putative proline-specific permease [compost metagenome]